METTKRRSSGQGKKRSKQPKAAASKETKQKNVYVAKSKPTDSDKVDEAPVTQKNRN